MEERTRDLTFPMPKIIVSKDRDELSTKAAAEFLRITKDAIDRRGSFSVALSGGSTPRALYAKLVGAGIDWSKVSFFFGDERNVPPDHADNNFRMANETLFSPLGISSETVFRWRTELVSPEEIAAAYERMIADHFSNAFPPPAHAGGSDRFPRFDLILLGLGADGHTASLFPRTAALQETERLAVENWVPQLDAWRFTLTFPVINGAANVMFLVSGKDKAETLRDVVEGERRPDELPAQNVRPTNGQLSWYVDEAAAGLLSGK